MKCPHCGIWFHDEIEVKELDRDVDGQWGVLTRKCAKCRRLILGVAIIKLTEIPQPSWEKKPKRYHWRPSGEEVLARPRKPISRDPVPTEVPDAFANDYREACLVLSDSPQASAALSRRCLQHILREKAGGKRRNLTEEIRAARDAGLPAHIADVLDEVRAIGNFAAHPEKDERTGEIVPVEPAEADHNLDVIEALFDHFFVQPAKTKKRREALNRKLAAVGKRPLGDGRAEKADDSSVAATGPTPDAD